MTQINSIAELKQEVLRLESEKAVIESRLKDHYCNIKESIHPANFIKSAVKSIVADKEITGVVKTKSVEAAFGLLMSQLVLRNSNPLIKALGGIMGTTMASSVFGDSAEHFIDKIKVLYKKYRDKHKGNGTGDFSENDIYEQ